MPRVRKRPAYLLHKATGQARVRLNGEDHHLGDYGSPASRHLYDTLIEAGIVRRQINLHVGRIRRVIKRASRDEPPHFRRRMKNPGIVRSRDFLRNPANPGDGGGGN